MSPTIYNLVRSQRNKTWPPGVFRQDGNVRRSVLCQFFWRATTEVVADLWLDQRSKPEILKISKPEIDLAMVQENWLALEAELGLSNETNRHIARTILGKSLWGAEELESRAPSLDELTSIGGETLPGLVLLAVHLARLNPSDASAFDYHFSELTMAARWLGFSHGGSAHESHLSNGLFELAGLNLQTQKQPLLSPFHDFYKPLQTLMERSGYRCAPRPFRASDELPRNLLRGSIPIQASSPIESDPPTGEDFTVEDELHQDSSFLRKQLEILRHQCAHLRSTQCSDLLESLMDPFLRYTGEFLDDLSKDTQYAQLAAECFRRVDRFPNLELIGRPGERVRLRLPQADYQLDPGFHSSRMDVSDGRFSIIRSGLKLRGSTIIPARVVPANQKD